MAEALSPRRKQILEFIESHTNKHGYPPTVREIGEAVDLSSPSTVHAHLRRLEENGLIRRDGMLTRAIRSLRDSVEASSGGTTRVPVLGRVAAGPPVLAHEEIEGYFGVPVEMIPDGRGFMLRVAGDSMIDAGIHDGDYVIVREQQTADDGDIVVALMDGEGTVKRIYRDNGSVRLQPANSNLSPMYTKDVKVVGKVVGLFRRLA